MTDPFYTEQWDQLCRRVRQSAEHHSEKYPDLAATITEEAEEFCQLDAPRAYKELLQRYSQAARMAIAWMGGRAGSEAAVATSDPTPAASPGV